MLGFPEGSWQSNAPAERCSQAGAASRQGVHQGSALSSHATCLEKLFERVSSVRL